MHNEVRGCTEILPKNENQRQGVKIIDICDSCAHEIFPVAVNINICWNNTIQTLVRLNKKI